MHLYHRNFSPSFSSYDSDSSTLIKAPRKTFSRAARTYAHLCSCLCLCLCLCLSSPSHTSAITHPDRRETVR